MPASKVPACFATGTRPLPPAARPPARVAAILPSRLAPRSLAASQCSHALAQPRCRAACWSSPAPASPPGRPSAACPRARPKGYVLPLPVARRLLPAPRRHQGRTAVRPSLAGNGAAAPGARRALHLPLPWPVSCLVRLHADMMLYHSLHAPTAALTVSCNGAPAFSPSSTHSTQRGAPSTGLRTAPARRWRASMQCTRGDMGLMSAGGLASPCGASIVAAAGHGTRARFWPPA